MKKFIAVLLTVVLTAAVAIGGTLAYLTDRDSEANVFTVGDVNIDLNEDFNQGATLIPGVDIEKKPTIKNVGLNSAWVWATIAVPSALDNDDASKNVIHFNYSKDADYNWTWTDSAGQWLVEKNVEIDGVKYNVYSVLYDEVLNPGETTEYPVIYKVYMDNHVDIDPDGNWHHVENGIVTDIEWSSEKNGNPVIFINAFAIQTEGFADVNAAYNAFIGQWGNMVDAGTYANADTWDGTADTTWFTAAPADTTEFVIISSEQMAGLSELIDNGETFEGKTLKLGKDIDLYALDANGERVCFDPIGSYRNDMAFKGIFDGQGHTIKNMHQNTWALDNGYSYTDLGLGLFGALQNATVKNLNIDGASISGESAICGAVAAYAENTTFENVKVSNTEVADYQYYAGGMVGWASGKNSFIGCVVDETTTVAGQWGDFDNSNGGIIGGIGSSAVILLKDCTVSCRIDAYNDVTSSYQWHAYRRSGMLIGNTGMTTTEGGKTVASAPQLTCENVTVIYEDCANYTYCEFAGTSWPYVRVQEGVSNSAYSNPRYGHPTDANGNKVVDDAHVHNDGEDHQILREFDQLYGGGQGVYGNPIHTGVTVVYNNK